MKGGSVDQAKKLSLEMGRHIVTRFGQIVPLLLIVSVIIFGLIHATPGDPVRIMMGNDSNPQLEQAIRRDLRLDQPLHVQYVEWVRGLLHGNLGKSIRTREPVTKLLADRLPTTLTLALLSMLGALGLAIPAGVAAASRPNSLADYGAMLLATLSWSVPNFVVAMVLIVVVAVDLGWLPISGSGDLFTTPLASWRYFAMPTAALAPIETFALGFTIWWMTYSYSVSTW